MTYTSHICLLGPVTIAGSDGNPVQIPQALVAQAQLGQLKPGPDGTITVQGADGKPIKIPTILPFSIAGYIVYKKNT